MTAKELAILAAKALDGKKGEEIRVMEVRELLLAEKKKGKIILLASHNSEDIRILCDGVFEMDGGRLQG